MRVNATCELLKTSKVCSDTEVMQSIIILDHYRDQNQYRDLVLELTISKAY